MRSGKAGESQRPKASHTGNRTATLANRFRRTPERGRTNNASRAELEASPKAEAEGREPSRQPLPLFSSVTTPKIQGAEAVNSPPHKSLSIAGDSAERSRCRSCGRERIRRTLSGGVPAVRCKSPGQSARAFGELAETRIRPPRPLPLDDRSGGELLGSFQGSRPWDR